MIMCQVYNFTFEQAALWDMFGIDAEPLWPLEYKLSVPCSIAHKTTSNEVSMFSSIPKQTDLERLQFWMATADGNLCVDLQALQTCLELPLRDDMGSQCGVFASYI